MDALELLSHYRQVEPAEDSTVAAAAMAILDAPDDDAHRPRDDLGRRRRLLGRRTLAAVGGIAAAVAIVAASVSVLGGHPSKPTTATSQGQPAGIKAILAAAQSAPAQQQAFNYIVVGTQTTWNGPDQTGGIASISKTWVPQGSPDFRIQELNAQGQLLLDSGRAVSNGVITQLDVQYRTHEVARHVTPISSLPSLPPGVCDVYTTRCPSFVVQQLNEGHFTLDGTAAIGGKKALHVLDDEPGLNRQLWIDPDTYLPIRATSSWTVGRGGSYEIDYQLVPKTPQALAALMPTAPANFRSVTQLTGP